MNEAMLALAIVLSVLGAIWLVMIVIAGKQLDVHRQWIAELEAELAELAELTELAELDCRQHREGEPPAHNRDRADYKRGV